MCSDYLSIHGLVSQISLPRTTRTKNHFKMTSSVLRIPVQWNVTLLERELLVLVQWTKMLFFLVNKYLLLTKVTKTYIVLKITYSNAGKSLINDFSSMF